MALPGQLHDRHRLQVLNELFATTSVCLIGAHAAAAYAPERATQDIDVFTTKTDYDLASKQLRIAAFRKDADLTFTQTALGLFGSRWKSESGGPPLDLISTNQDWGDEVFGAAAQFTKSGDRVMPLAYLVLMKLDAARSIDQGDLSRILGRLSDEQVDDVVAVVARLYRHDPAAIEDVRQYAEVGRWEYQVQDADVHEPASPDANLKASKNAPKERKSR
jgi:hypothetical protein